jgi:hypothetical protein
LKELIQKLKNFGVRLISDQAAFSGVVDGWISLRGNLGNTYAIKILSLMLLG